MTFPKYLKIMPFKGLNPKKNQFNLPQKIIFVELGPKIYSIRNSLSANLMCTSEILVYRTNRFQMNGTISAKNDFRYNPGLYLLHSLSTDPCYFEGKQWRGMNRYCYLIICVRT